MPRLTIALSPAALRTSASRRRSVAAPLAAVALACAAATAWAESPAQPAASTALDLRSFVQQIQSSNRAIKSKRTERDIAATSISRAQAAFDPVVSASTQRSGTRQQNTVEEESLSRRGEVYERFGTDYSAAVSRLLSSGAKVEGKVTLSKFLTSTKQILSPGAESDVRSFYAVTVTEPLASEASSGVCDAASAAALDDALVTWFPARHSPTGEDVIEFSVHGGSYVSTALMAALMTAGARAAPPAISRTSSARRRSRSGSGEPTLSFIALKPGARARRCRWAAVWPIIVRRNSA